MSSVFFGRSPVSKVPAASVCTHQPGTGHGLARLLRKTAVWFPNIL